MREILPDVILPISDEPTREACVAVGPGLHEILWITGPKATAGKSSFARPTAMQLHSYRSGPRVTTQPWRATERPHHVQRTKNGLLFVNARAKDDQPNAWSTDASLRSGRRLSLGDGVSDVRVSPSGSIWAAYFDEGVFGGGRGAAGLVKFDGRGRTLWEYDALKAGTDDVADVYAFNLAAEDDAWIYFYTPFSIVRWLRGSPTVWQTRVEGAKAMAVRPGQALLLGDYDDPTLIRILELPRGGGSAKVKNRLRLRLPEGTEPESIQAFGVADRLVLWSARDLMILQGW